VLVVLLRAGVKAIDFCADVAAGGEVLRRRQKGQNRAARARGRRREGRGPKDLCAKLKDPREPSVKQNFPLI
jgi:hypothetical protein